MLLFWSLVQKGKIPNQRSGKKVQTLGLSLPNWLAYKQMNQQTNSISFGFQIPLNWRQFEIFYNNKQPQFPTSSWILHSYTCVLLLTWQYCWLSFRYLLWKLSLYPFAMRKRTHTKCNHNTTQDNTNSKLETLWN